MLFSFVMLTNFRAKMSSWEIILSIWTSILLIEEVKQVSNIWCIEITAVLMQYDCNKCYGNG